MKLLCHFMLFGLIFSNVDGSVGHTNNWAVLVSGILFCV